MIGTTVSHYEIREKLGAGGMGVVYKAWDTRLDRWVALKFLPQHADRDPLARERFIREAKAASALEHPHICTVHEIGETEDGQLYICMAYYAGGTLRQAMHEGKITPSRAFEISRQICQALHGAHEAGIVHRDLKPSNIMLTAQDDVAIVDFGLAKLTGEASITRTGATMGTAAYMSPEQVTGRELDHRTDLWSLGVILYQLLTGHYPFKGDYDNALKRAILEDGPAPPTEADPDLPPVVDHIIGRLLTKARGDRVSSAAEVEQLLRGISQSGGSEAPTQADFRSATSSHTEPRRRSRFPIGAALVGAALVVVVLIIAWQFGQRGSAPAPVQSLAVMPFANFTGDTTQAYLGDGLATGLITSLSELRNLQVLSRSEVWMHRDRGWSARRLGDRLGVDTLLEGSIENDDSNLVATTTLIDVGSGAVVWSEAFSAPESSLSELRKSIADRLTQVLSIRVSESERKRLLNDPTQSYRAYELYLQGQVRLADPHTAENPDAAVELFNQAIRLDPEFALAYAGLSEAFWEIWRRDSDAAALEASETEARRALEIDADLPAGRLALARVQRSTGRYEDAIAAIEDALATHPNPDRAHRELATSYEQSGDLDSAEAALRAATLVGERNWSNWNALAVFLLRKGDYDQAREGFQTAVRIAPPNVWVPQRNLASLELQSGKIKAALDAFEKIPGTHQTASLASNIGTAYYFSDEPDKWSKALEHYQLATRLAPRNDEIRRNLADLYLETGESEKARAQYLEALRLVDEQLSNDPSSFELRLRRAFYSARAADCETALGQMAVLRPELPPTARNAHRSAYVYALCAQHELAIGSLQAAVDLGMPTSIIGQEREFDGLRGDARFAALVATESVAGEAD